MHSGLLKTIEFRRPRKYGFQIRDRKIYMIPDRRAVIFDNRKYNGAAIKILSPTMNYPTLGVKQPLIKFDRLFKIGYGNKNTKNGWSVIAFYVTSKNDYFLSQA